MTHQPPFQGYGTPVGPVQPAGRKTPVWPFIVGGAALLAVLCVAGLVIGGFLLRDRAEDLIDEVANPTSSAGGGGNSADWAGRLVAIDGVVDHHPAELSTQHTDTTVDYPQQPPVGGEHNGVWQNCSGAVYTAPIANEHAVHSMEHGAVWITYREGLDAAQVAKLAQRVTGVDYMMLSPVTDQSDPISLQAWGYQLRVPSADDGRIDRFIVAARQNASLEPGAPCVGGTRDTGPLPR
jgi:hypothetical protein